MIFKMEPRQLSLLTKRTTFAQWMAFRLSVGASTATYTESDTMENAATDSVDAVIIFYVFNKAEVSEHLTLLRHAQRIARKQVFSVARACDSGFSLYEWLAKEGLTTEMMGINNLGNRVIARLKPHSATFLLSCQTFSPPHHLPTPSKETLFWEFVQGIHKSHMAIIERDGKAFTAINRVLPTKLSVNVVDIAMVWNLSS